jgi:hypothetical protein
MLLPLARFIHRSFIDPISCKIWLNGYMVIRSTTQPYSPLTF